ncbi:MAG: hypothetical protein HKN13_13730 [Rhodothermales bacterium]|nr:hypothetical protein [Rhodothermales bacterium]
MVEGYDSADANQNIPPELDDYICDYVDGSMDDSVREVFEEFLQANPNVRAHVCRVAQTAELLREHSRCLCAPDGFDTRLKCAVENEDREESGRFAVEAMSRLSGIVLSSSTIAIVCLGMVVFSFDRDQTDLMASQNLLMEMFGEEAEALEGVAAESYGATAAVARTTPDRGSLQRAARGPYSPGYMRQIVLEDAPVPVFMSVSQSPVPVLYP